MTLLACIEPHPGGCSPAPAAPAVWTDEERGEEYWIRRGDEMRNEARRRFGYQWPDIVARWLGKCLRDEAKDATRAALEAASRENER